ncbi:hypothetical protein FOA52_003169 [Chlamydomonas sp. UWO 241]|nr:hypothetical protein FOA52_003169 [Chlamydomonas sp. UWO 241]
MVAVSLGSARTNWTYQTIRTLGRGAFGEVVLARVVETGAVVAIKRIHIRKSTADGLPDNVLREVRALQVLDHPNIVQLIDVFAQGHSIRLVQEYCFSDLQRLTAGATDVLPEGFIKGVMQQVLRGVASCHATGIMHRDLKPSNILVTRGGWVKLADFGLARPIDPSERPQYTHTVATRWYRAPELLYGARRYGPGVDVWAVGMVAAELIGLSPLVPGENDIDQLSKMISLLGDIEPRWPGVSEMPDYGKVMFPSSEGRPLAQLLPAASPHALDLVAKLLRYDPERRLTAVQALQHPLFFVDPLPWGPERLAPLLEQMVAT